MRFALQSPPHARPIARTPATMRHVLYALAPAGAAHVWYFGWGLCLNLLFAIAAAWASEAVMLRLRGRPAMPALMDGTALVTAVLLAFAIPPLAPWWLPAIGAAAAIMLAKHLYGGTGSNLFNPAMVGYAILLISFPLEMTHWLPPRGAEPGLVSLDAGDNLRFALTGALSPELSSALSPAPISELSPEPIQEPSPGLPPELSPQFDIDAVTRATPLDQMREALNAGRTLPDMRADMRAGPLFGSVGGHGWEWINGLVAIGGLYLLWRGIIRWHIPASMLLALLVFAALCHAIDANRYASAGFHLFSGASLLGAFFIATDPVTAATTNLGRLIQGAGIGLLTYAIRTWGGYPDGLAFAVLLMNATVPLLDRYTRPRIHGRPR